MVNLNKNTVSYFSYIMLGNQFHFIKDVNNPDIIKAIMAMQKGDTLRIKGLGTLKLVNFHYQPYDDEYGHTVKEIGIICNRIDA